MTYSLLHIKITMALQNSEVSVLEQTDVQQAALL